MFGVGLVRFPDAQAARAFADGDPTVRSGRGFRIDVFPMPNGVVTAGSLQASGPRAGAS